MRCGAVLDTGAVLFCASAELELCAMREQVGRALGYDKGYS